MTQELVLRLFMSRSILAGKCVSVGVRRAFNKSASSTASPQQRLEIVGEKSHAILKSFSETTKLFKVLNKYNLQVQADCF